MKSGYSKRQYKKRRKRLRYDKKRGNGFKVFFAVLGVLLLIAVAAVGVMFALEIFFKIDTPLPPDGVFGKFADALNAEMVVSPTPYVTEIPTEEPHPMDLFDGKVEEKEVVFPADLNYAWLGDPYCCNGRIICSAGKLIDGRVLMCRLVQYDIATAALTELPVEPKNDHLMFPAFNDKWLVYFDAHYSVGGGNICVIDMNSPYSAPAVVKEVYIGQPELKLWGDYMAWIERTGSERDKIFVCDLRTMETTVVAFFNRSDYGTSMPFIADGKLLWSEESGSGTSSMIKYYDLENGTQGEYRTGVYVHDPEYNGRYYAWLDSHHSEDTGLYVSDGTENFLVARGVAEFGISDKFVAYGLDNAVYIYLFENKTSYRITPEREDTQFLGTTGGTVMWMDVTSRERDIIKFAIPPI